MKTTTKLLSLLLLLAIIVSMAASCEIKEATKLEILNGESIILELGESVQLKAKTDGVYSPSRSNGRHLTPIFTYRQRA